MLIGFQGSQGVAQLEFTPKSIREIYDKLRKKLIGLLRPGTQKKTEHGNARILITERQLEILSVFISLSLMVPHFILDLLIFMCLRMLKNNCEDFSLVAVM